MVLVETDVCEFGKPAVPFSLKGTDGKEYSLSDCKGEHATLVMFICNHCPYVQAIQERLVHDIKTLITNGIQAVAIMPNDSTDYPEDSFENMQKTAKMWDYPFPYLLDHTQETAKAYGAECTPDFFGYNHDLELQYRGRLDAWHQKPAPKDAKRELVDAMLEIAKTGCGPKQQFPSLGCSIKWKACQ